MFSCSVNTLVDNFVLYGVEFHAERSNLTMEANKIALYARFDYSSRAASTAALDVVVL